MATYTYTVHQDRVIHSQNYMIWTVVWSRHTINMFVLLHLPPWRWPH